MAHPELGPGHPNTLNSRRLVADLLGQLGRAAEALPIARAVADAQASHPELGPDHPDTVITLKLVTDLRRRLGPGA